MAIEAGDPGGPMAALRAEHESIEVVLDAWETMAEAALVGAFTDADRMRSLIRFMRDFGDGAHHAKEEEALFPALARSVLPPGPLAQMRAEHDQGRKALALLASVLEGDYPRPPADWREIARLSSGYIETMRGHIRKENQCIFLTADIALPGEARSRLAAEFLRIDAEWERRHGPAGRARIEEVLQECDAWLASVWTRA